MRRERQRQGGGGGEEEGQRRREGRIRRRRRRGGLPHGPLWASRSISQPAQPRAFSCSYLSAEATRSSSLICSREEDKGKGPVKRTQNGDEGRARVKKEASAGWRGVGLTEAGPQTKKAYAKKGKRDKQEATASWLFFGRTCALFAADTLGVSEVTLPVRNLSALAHSFCVRGRRERKRSGVGQRDAAAGAGKRLS